MKEPGQCGVLKATTTFQGLSTGGEGEGQERPLREEGDTSLSKSTGLPSLGQPDEVLDEMGY